MNKSDFPLLSIITPCLNCAAYIEKAILSVVEQDYQNIEHIVVDGGSKDGTLEIISRYDHLRLIKERDQKGVYHANNKGIEDAYGELIGILNSDDYYSANIFQNIVNIFKNESVEVVCGGAEFFYQDGKKPPYIWMPDAGGDALIQALGVPLINTCFFRKSLLERVRGFDSRYRFAGDRELLIRLASIGIRLYPLEKIIYHYRLHSRALTSNPYEQWHVKSRLERLDILERYINNSSFSKHDMLKLRQWHGLNVAWLVRAAIAKRHFPAAVRYAYHSCRYHSGWLGIYMRLFIPSPLKLLTGIKGYISGIIRKYPVHEK